MKHSPLKRCLMAAIVLILLAVPSIWLARQYHQLNLNRDLIDAIRDSDASRVDALLAAGANSNA